MSGGELPLTSWNDGIVVDFIGICYVGNELSIHSLD
jgi:hypothetical protein